MNLPTLKIIGIKLCSFEEYGANAIGKKQQINDRNKTNNIIFLSLSQNIMKAFLILGLFLGEIVICRTTSPWYQEQLSTLVVGNMQCISW